MTETTLEIFDNLPPIRIVNYLGRLPDNRSSAVSLFATVGLVILKSIVVVVVVTLLLVKIIVKTVGAVVVVTYLVVVCVLVIVELRIRIGEIFFLFFYSSSYYKKRCVTANSDTRCTLG